MDGIVRGSGADRGMRDRGSRFQVPVPIFRVGGGGLGYGGAHGGCSEAT